MINPIRFDLLMKQDCLWMDIIPYRAMADIRHGQTEDSPQLGLEVVYPSDIVYVGSSHVVRCDPPSWLARVSSKTSKA